MKPSAFQWAHYLLIFTAAILIIFGVGSLLRINVNPDRAGLYVFYALAMFGDAAVMLLCVWTLNQRMRFAFHFAVLVLALNILLTIFDQFGPVDLLFVLLNLVTLAALIAARRNFLPA